jgi:nucleoside-diphosphate-sugar epimerase
VGSTCNLLDWARRSGVRRVVLRGTTAVIGPLDLGEGEVDETHPCQPEDLYGRSKLTAERTSLQWATRHGVPLVVARLAPVFGGGARFEPLERALRYAITGVLREQPSNAWLHPVHLKDAIAALVLLCLDERRVSRVYQVSGAARFTERQLFRQVAGLAGRPSLEERLPATEPGAGQGFSSRRLRGELGYRPRCGLDQELLRTLIDATKRGPRAPEPRASAVHTAVNGMLRTVRSLVAGAA